MADKTLVCKSCSAEFLFTEGEQNFFKEKGFQNEPQRCLSCRTKIKSQRRGPSSFPKSKGFGNRFGGVGLNRW
ncbi:zinc-ribbon domain-containing protein [Acetivibrio cellulolyticus]|uniref:zinc-ribbon domain-containing protein n=1 Tax=Acetivibrio cellulolyticus TaxID=35830 RepID=UPI0001E2C1C9|nr:zinc-ribbon domain-containing protein [Acetivibrio cellulolyticus]